MFKITARQFAFGTLLGILVIGLCVYQNYGISTDEYLEAQMVIWHLQNLKAGKPIEDVPLDLEYYGLFFNAIGLFVFLVYKTLTGGYQPLQEIFYSGMASGELFITKHLVTFVFSLLAYIGIILCLKDLKNWFFATCGVVVMALTPRFWGHSFFNPKDIPFAALFILVTYAGAHFTAQVLEPESDKNSNNFVGGSLYRKSLVFGVSVGMLTAIRAGGFVVLGFGLLALLVILLLRQIASDQRNSENVPDGFINKLKFLTHSNSGDQTFSLLHQLFLPYGAVVITWAVTTIILNPVAWRNPFGWFVKTVIYLSNHDWEGVTLTFGQNLAAHPPWFYLPVWFGVTTPLITILLAIIGLITTYLRFVSLSSIQQSLIVYLSLQIFVLPLIAILKGSTIYNGIRQFLFILPPIIVFTILGFAFCLNFFSTKFWKITLSTVIAIAYLSVAIDCIKLHPYEYIYLNSLARNYQIEEEFETDYWGLSVREATEWINLQPEVDKTLYYHAPDISIKPFLNEGIEAKSLPQGYYSGEIQNNTIEKPFYYLAYPRNKYGEIPHPQDFFPSCEKVFEVNRLLGSKAVPLTIVKQCK